MVGALIGSNKHKRVPKNKLEFRLLLHIKIMEPTFLGGGPWSLAEPMGAHWDGKIADE